MKAIRNWVKKLFGNALKSDFERYLEGSKDIFDLEERMKQYYRRKYY